MEVIRVFPGMCSAFHRCSLQERYLDSPHVATLAAVDVEDTDALERSR
jgi:hypothetical protein